MLKIVWQGMFQYVICLNFFSHFFNFSIDVCKVSSFTWVTKDALVSWVIWDLLQFNILIFDLKSFRLNAKVLCHVPAALLIFLQSTLKKSQRVTTHFDPNFKAPSFKVYCIIFFFQIDSSIDYTKN